MANVRRFRRKRLQSARQRSRSGGRVRLQSLLLLLSLLLVATGAAAVVSGFVAYRIYASDFKSPDEVIAASGQGASRVFDGNGRFLYQFVDPVGGVRDPVPLEEISPWLIQATISTEDASFYSNPGVNIKGLVRAAWENLTPFGPGLFQGSGGSSITQQLVKNVYIKPEDRFDRRIERKIKETVLAIELKRRYEDDRILEWYLNQVDYGNFAFGAEAAAQRYFSKSATELTLAEATLLAGIPQAPGIYTPALPENRERVIARQHDVLDLMVKHDYITRQQAEEAKEEPLSFTTPRFLIEAPHFVFYIQETVTKMCQKGVFEPETDVPCDKVLLQGNLNVTTTLDLGLQDIGERIVEEIISANEGRFNGHNGAIVAIDPRTGQILAMVGSRDFFREDIQGQNNIATSLRSHGSSMKPITYLTAFKQGWVPSATVKDAPLSVQTFQGEHRINNWNFSYLGNITVRKALAESVNVAAVRTAMEVGVDDFRQTAHELGITDLRRQDCGPTITLGSCEVKLLDMVYAYATIANNGVMKGMPTLQDLPDGFRSLDPVAVLKIEDSSGNVLYEYEGPEREQVIRSAYAYMVADILSNDAIHWSRLTLPFPAAAKTGTSEDFKDNVVLGFTRSLAVGVWMGNADGTAMANGTFSSAGTGPMWKEFMLAASDHLGLVGQAFQAPNDVVFASCGDRQEVFVKDEVPRKSSACAAPGQAAPDFPTPTTPTPTPTPGDVDIDGNEVRLKGTIESVGEFTFIVNADGILWTVDVDGDTEIEGDLESGLSVRVEGILLEPGHLLAEKVKL